MNAAAFEFAICDRLARRPVSRAELAADLGVPRYRLDRPLRRLREDEMIAVAGQRQSGPRGGRPVKVLRLV